MKSSWYFIHICDLQPGSSRSFRFELRMMENWQTALAQLSELNADLLLAGGDLTRDGSLYDFEFEVIRSEWSHYPILKTLYRVTWIQATNTPMSVGLPVGGIYNSA